MKYQSPQVVELTDDESKLYELIVNSSDTNGELTPIADVMESLFKLLIERNAIPEMRLRIFADPKYAEKWNKTPKQIFESYGTCGDEIYRHPQFIEYLLYFINGPDLPDAAINSFCKILNEDKGTSGMIPDQLHHFVRSCVREYDLDRHSAASNFYKLAIELGIKHASALSVRIAAMSTR
jgi:hypothetical protein